MQIASASIYGRRTFFDSFGEEIAQPIESQNGHVRGNLELVSLSNHSIGEIGVSLEVRSNPARRSSDQLAAASKADLEILLPNKKLRQEIRSLRLR